MHPSLSSANFDKIKDGAPRQNRTGTPLRELDFESSASTNSARGATVLFLQGSFKRLQSSVLSLEFNSILILSKSHGNIINHAHLFGLVYSIFY